MTEIGFYHLTRSTLEQALPRLLGRVLGRLLRLVVAVGSFDMAQHGQADDAVLGRQPDAAQGVAQADIYQMMAYGRLYACPRLMLLYPHPAGPGRERVQEGVQETFRIAGSADLLAVATVDLARLDAMPARLRGLVDGQLGGASAGGLHVGSAAHG